MRYHPPALERAVLPNTHTRGAPPSGDWQELAAAEFRAAGKPITRAAIVKRAHELRTAAAGHIEQR
jgi:hypothetical protein